MEIKGYRVFYLDPEEGINEIIKLITTTMAKKMALVIHSKVQLLNSQVNLKLIARYAKKHDKELVFINPDPVIKEKLLAVNFPVYTDLNALEADMPLRVEAATKEEDNKKDKKGNKKIYSILNIFVLAFILIMAYLYFFYPTVIIELKPVMQETKQNLSITAALDITRIDWENKIIPLHQFSMTETNTESIASTGYRIEGISPALGRVRFINERESNLTIKTGTVVSTTEGIQFRTLEDIEVPALKVDYLMGVPVGRKAGQAEVKIEALEKGSRGNVSTGQIKQIEPNISQVHVINPEPSRGGEDNKISFVSAQDIERLKASLEEKLKAQLLTNIFQQLGGNYRIISDQITYSNLDITIEEQVNTKADFLTGAASLTANGYLLRNNELDRLVTVIFQENIADNLELLSSGINIESLRLAQKEEKVYNVELELLAPVLSKINTSNLVKSLRGIDLEVAKEILSQKVEIEEYIINTDAETLPSLGFAIKVVVQEADGYRISR